MSSRGTIGQRLEQARGRISRAKLAEMLQEHAGEDAVSSRTIARYEHGDRNVPVNFVEAAARALGQDARWILTGEGRAPEGLDEMPPQTQESGDLPTVTDPEEIVWITLSGARPTAGGGGAPDELRRGRYPLLSSVAKALGHPHVKLAAVQVRGDSMSPTLSDGDYVIVAADPAAMDDICLLEIRGELWVKRVHRDIATGGLLIVSDNKAYKDQPIGPDSDVRIIGRVVKEDRMRRR